MAPIPISIRRYQEYVVAGLQELAKADGIRLEVWTDYVTNSLRLGVVFGEATHVSVLLHRHEIDRGTHSWASLIAERYHEALQVVKPAPMTLETQADEYDETMRAQEIMDNLS